MSASRSKTSKKVNRIEVKVAPIVDERLDCMSASEAVSRSEVVRRALDLYYRMVHSPGIDWEELRDRQRCGETPTV